MFEARKSERGGGGTARERDGGKEKMSEIGEGGVCERRS